MTRAAKARRRARWTELVMLNGMWLLIFGALFLSAHDNGGRMATTLLAVGLYALMYASGRWPNVRRVVAPHVFMEERERAVRATREATLRAALMRIRRECIEHGDEPGTINVIRADATQALDRTQPPTR